MQKYTYVKLELNFLVRDLPSFETQGRRHQRFKNTGVFASAQPFMHYTRQSQYIVIISKNRIIVTTKRTDE